MIHYSLRLNARNLRNPIEDGVIQRQADDPETDAAFPTTRVGHWTELLDARAKLRRRRRSRFLGLSDRRGDLVRVVFGVQRVLLAIPIRAGRSIKGMLHA